MQVEPPVTAAQGGQGASLLLWTQVSTICPEHFAPQGTTAAAAAIICPLQTFVCHWHV